MEIAVIGAGHGGLQAAYELGKSGFEVIVFEKNSRDKLGWDWRDDVEYTVFDELNIEIPEGSYKGDAVSLVAPLSEKALYVYSEKDKREWNLDRRVFLSQLVKRAEAVGVKFYFDCPVEKLCSDASGVNGIILNGKNIRFDLVIDSSGILSDFRKDIPEKFGMQDKITEENTFSVYRAFVNKREGVTEPTKNRKKIYLKYRGLPGIAWCVCENGWVNILAGKVGIMTDKELEETLGQLKKDNPIIGDTVLRGGCRAVIPVRYPLTKAVCPGYAAIGDTAYMTIPLIGSGMANSLRAGHILAQHIIKDKSVKVDTLWKYQYDYFKQIGADHFLVDRLKRTLLYADNSQLKYVFESGIITDEDMLNLTTGNGLKLSPAELAKKLGKGIKVIGLVINVASAGIDGLRIKKLAEKIPKTYNEEEIKIWQSKTAKAFAGKGERK